VSAARSLRQTRSFHAGEFLFPNENAGGWTLSGANGIAISC